MKRLVGLALLTVGVTIGATAAQAAWQPVERSYGQVVLLPAGYVDFSYTRGGTPVSQMLYTTVVIRNSDSRTPITLKSLVFYGPAGEAVKEFIPSPVTLGPRSSLKYEFTASTLPVQPYPRTGERPSAVLTWEADTRVIPPNIDCARMFLRPDGDYAEFLAFDSIPVQVLRERVP